VTFPAYTTLAITAVIGVLLAALFAERPPGASLSGTASRGANSLVARGALPPIPGRGGGAGSA
jgi:hypothetical protein